MFALITFFDQPKLYCKYQDLRESLDHPTTFCTIAGINVFLSALMSSFITDVHNSFLGVAFHYCIVNATLWWFFHVSVIFYKLVWPLKAMQTVKYEKYVHLFLVIIGKHGIRIIGGKCSTILSLYNYDQATFLLI